MCLQRVSNFSSTTNSFRTTRNTASCARGNVRVERKERVPKRTQPALSVAWKQPFPSNQRRADPCFVAHVFRNSQWQADTNRYQLAPCRLPDDPCGGFVHVFAAMFMSHMEIELNCEPFADFRIRSVLGFHERHLNAASTTLRRDGMRSPPILNYQFRWFPRHMQSLRRAPSHR